jgi:HEAT repeat protein
MHDLRRYVQERVSQLSGSKADDAWHSLVEAGPDALPLLIESFHRSNESGVRAALIAVISELRSAQGVPFLAALLRDRDAKVRRAALDGLVTAASPTALNALRAAKIAATSELAEWIDEAISQIEDSQGPG